MQVLTWPNPLLSLTAKPVTDEERGTAAFQSSIDEMIAIVKANEAVGLAATQVGWDRRVFVMKSMNGEPWEHINPRLLHADEPKLAQEGCLSFPGVQPEYLEAPSRVVLGSTDLLGRTKEFFLYDLFARCAFHEIKHLDGITMLDRMGKLQRRLFLKAYMRARR